MRKEKILRSAFTFLIMAVILFQFTVMSKASDTPSNNLICWGLKRSDNHEQPTLDKNSLEILNKYNGIAIRK